MDEEIIGRVMISEKYPATPEYFYAWIAPEFSQHIEIGSWVIAEDPADPSFKYFCTVEDIKNISTATSFDEFYSHNMGNPEYEPKFKPEVLIIAKLRILKNSKNSLIAPVDRLRVKFMDVDDMGIMFSDIVYHSQRRIIGGVVKGKGKEGDSYIPVYFDANYILGPEAAHLNISGISGMASKTSYSIFLIYSILKWAEENDKKPLIVIFNVKSADFMYFHETLEEGDIEGLLENKFKPKAIERTIKIYDSLKDAGFDLIETHNRIARGDLYGFKYFTFEGDPVINISNAPEDHTEYIRYGLWDLTSELLKAALFRPSGDAIQQEGFIDRLFTVKNEVKHNITSLDDLIKELDNSSRGSSSRTVQIVNNPELEIHISSAGALSRRLKTFRSVSTKIVDPNIGSFSEEEEKRIGNDAIISKPIDISRFIPGINVIQLVGLSTSEQKILVLDTAKKIYNEMMKSDDKRKFDFAIIVVDELNKYAPKGDSPWKHVLVDISERGRERQIVLFGIEQFASKVDEEVIGNPNTHVLGRQDPQEVKYSYYKRFGDTRNYSHLLDKGDLIVTHAVYPTPLRVHFPIPPVKIISGR